MAMNKGTVHLDNLEAFIAEAEASESLPDDIRLIQKTYDLSQEDVARQFGLTQQAISQCLRGEIQLKCKHLIHYTAEKIRSG
jgi:transcriptional regulator with XRE-family HTH domain